MNDPFKPKALQDMARGELRRWARVYAERDELVRRAHQSGIGVNELAKTTGLAKTTILRILGGQS